jgi:pre-mRNA-processing factor 6
LEFSEFESGGKDQSAAIQVLERALGHHPNDLQLHLRLSKLYQAANDFDKARAVLVQCACEKAWKRAALMDISAGRISTAQKTLEEGIQRYPNYPRLYLLLADLFPDPVHKRNSLDSAMRKCPDSAVVWIRAARFEESQGASIKSRYLLDKARRHCLDPAVWQESARLEIRLNNLKAAQGLVLEGLKLYPKSGVLWAEAIRLEPRQTRKAKTVDALEKCEEAPEVLVEAARLFWEDRKMEKARLWFRKSLSKAGKWGDAVIYFYQFEQEQTDSHAEELLQEVATSKYKYGEVWEQTDASQTTAERVKSGADMLKSG